MPKTPPDPDWMTPTGRPWRVLEEREVYQNPWIRVREYQAEAPTGAQTLYGVVGFRNQAIGVLPLYPDGTTVLVGQHRFPLGDYTWEIPEGGVPVGSDPLEGARRELREETGLEAGTWIEVLSYQVSNSVSDEIGFGFIATDLHQSEAEPDDTEALALARIPFMDALDLAACGRLQDLITVAMLLRAHHMAVEGRLPEALAKAMLARSGETR
jgi:8-oxo-dGTP pyrophosphatase MutT (NUDIX family)